MRGLVKVVSDCCWHLAAELCIFNATMSAAWNSLSGFYTADNLQFRPICKEREWEWSVFKVGTFSAALCQGAILPVHSQALLTCSNESCTEINNLLKLLWCVLMLISRLQTFGIAFVFKQKVAPSKQLCQRFLRTQIFASSCSLKARATADFRITETGRMSFIFKLGRCWRGRNKSAKQKTH